MRVKLLLGALFILILLISYVKINYDSNINHITLQSNTTVPNYPTSTSSTETLTQPSSSTQDIMTFLSEAKKSLEECDTTLKRPLAPGSNLKYLNITILNETTIKLEGKKYKYAILGIWNVSFSGEASINGYRIIWEQPNITTTGGQRIDFKIYKNDTAVGSFTYWYIPFQLDSYCLMIDSKPINLTDNTTLSFIFMHMKKKDLWLVMLDV